MKFFAASAVVALAAATHTELGTPVITTAVEPSASATSTAPKCSTSADVVLCDDGSSHPIGPSHIISSARVTTTTTGFPSDATCSVVGTVTSCSFFSWHQPSSSPSSVASVSASSSVPAEDCSTTVSKPAESTTTPCSEPGTTVVPPAQDCTTTSIRPGSNNNTTTPTAPATVPDQPATVPVGAANGMQAPAMAGRLAAIGLAVFML